MTQVSPLCRTVGRFVVVGRKGVNRIRFAGRLRGTQLSPGTYKIAARTGRRVVKRVTIVLVENKAPTKAELASAKASNVCSATRAIASTASQSIGASNTASLAEAPNIGRSARPVAVGAARGSNTHSGVLASAVEKTARAIRPALVALLATAILLLTLASLPREAVPEPRLNDLLARHRVEIAGVGAAAFVAVVLAFLVGTG